MSQVSIVDIEGNNPQILTEVVADTGTAIPIANTLEIHGLTAPANLRPVFTTASANVVNINVQIARAFASTNILNAGLASFNSTYFSVDANGFVSFIGASSITINGDQGSITGGNLTIFANYAAKFCGSTVRFTNTGTVSTLNVTDANGNTNIGTDSGFTGSSGTFNTGIGRFSLNANSSGSHNTAGGNGSLQKLVSGSNNSAFGDGAAFQLLTGSYNLFLGLVAGQFYNGAESSNICIMHNGVNAESNTMRIGTHGTGNGQVSRTFIAGINGNTITSPNVVTIDPTTGQLGTASGTLFVGYRKVTGNASVLPADKIIGESSTAAAYTISLPNPLSGGLVAGQVWTIKDESMGASINNITINITGATALIDGAATAVINTNGGALDIYFDGTNYFIK